MQFLSNDIIRATGWTLIHSLWQGLVLALVAGILILFTRKASPALRYNIFTLLFFLLVGSALCTFFYELRQPAAPTATVMPAQAFVSAEAVAEPQAAGLEPAQGEPVFTARFAAYFNEHAPLLVMLWFIVFVARSLWLFGGLVYVQRIRHYKTSAPGALLVSKMEELSRRLRLNSKVQLLESAMIKVPTALGMLKPVILMPLGMMAQLPADQVEAVLLHELAHIRRRDFLVNLIQHFAETIFFFNPALLWLSARIREEREHCCDDMAIAVTQSRTGYIQALVSFQEYQLTARTKYAMAFPGKKKQLLDRVKRILGSHNKTLNMAEKSFLLLCFSLIGMLGIVFSQPDKKQEQKHPSTEQVAKMDEPDMAQESSAPDDRAPEQTTATEETPDREQPAEEEQSASDTVMNDIYHLPYKQEYQPYKSEYQSYKPKRDSVPVPVLKKGNVVMSGIITTSVGDTQYKITVDNNKATGLQIDGVKVPDDQLHSKYAIINSIFRDMEHDQDAAEKTGKLQEAERMASWKKAEALQQQLTLQKQQQTLELSSTATTAAASDTSGSASLVLVSTPANTAQPVLAPGAAISTGGRIQLAPRPVATTAPKLKTDVDKIIADLLKDGLITQEHKLSFRLNKKAFIVNEKPQSEEMFRKYQQKYIKQPADAYLYTRSGTQSTAHIITVTKQTNNQ